MINWCFILNDTQCIYCISCVQNTWVPRKIVASNVPTTIDKLHARDDYQSDGRRGVQQPHAPEKLETDRLKRLGNRPQV